MTCEDCNGHGFHYSDNGPAPKRIECAECYGVGSWEEEDDMPATLDQQLADFCTIHDLKSMSLHIYRRSDGTYWFGTNVHRELGHATSGYEDGETESTTAALKSAMTRLNDVRIPEFAPIEVAA